MKKVISTLKINDGREIKTTTEGNPTEEEKEMMKQVQDLFNKYSQEGLVPATLKFEFE